MPTDDLGVAQTEHLPDGHECGALVPRQPGDSAVHGIADEGASQRCFASRAHEQTAHPAGQQRDEAAAGHGPSVAADQLRGNTIAIQQQFGADRVDRVLDLEITGERLIGDRPGLLNARDDASGASLWARAASGFGSVAARARQRDLLMGSCLSTTQNQMPNMSSA